MSKTLTIDEIKRRIITAHGKQVRIDEGTFINTRQRARFIDDEYGEWWAVVNNVLRGRGHRKRGIE